MARLFTAASSEKITLSLGALGFAFGPGTMAAIVRPTTLPGTSMNIFTAGASNTVRYGLFIGTGSKVQAAFNSTAPAAAAASPVLTTGGWFVVAATKDTGTVAPRYHTYPYSTGVWSHANSAGTSGNSSVAATRAAFATDGAGTAGFWNGDIACCAVWNVVLTDSQVESLAYRPTPASWQVASGAASACLGDWFLRDPVATSVLDVTGGGANQSSIVGTLLTADDFPLFEGSVPSPVASPAWAA